MKKIILLLATVATMAACSPYVLKSSGALNNSNLADYKTFEVQQIDKSKLPSNIDETDLIRLYRAISAELEKRGYKYVKSDGDITMHIGLSKKNHIETTENTTGFIDGVGMHAGAWGRYNYYGATPYVRGYVGNTTSTTKLVTDGVVVVDLVDNSDNNHVFCAQLSANIDGEHLILRDNEKLAKAATKLFKKFPVPIKK